MDNWEEFLGSLRSMTFVQYYRCRPISLLNKHNVDEDGNRIIMPPSALERLSSLRIEYPMMFQIQNPETERVSHCGVLEFVADEGFVYMPASMMAHLGLEEDELVLMKSASLPRGTFVKLQPHTTDFLLIANPGELLEYSFGKYPCMTVGETITVMGVGVDGRQYRLDVVEARPAGAVATLETDCEVEFATPLDYKEPAAQKQAPPPPPAGNDDEPLVRFAGVGMRMDGRPVEKAAPAVSSAAGSSSVNGKRVLRFGGGSVAATGGTREKEKEVAERFAGQKYSLMDPMDESTYVGRRNGFSPTKEFL